MKEGNLLLPWLWFKEAHFIQFRTNAKYGKMKA